jgi:hypothetical protein
MESDQAGGNRAGATPGLLGYLLVTKEEVELRNIVWWLNTPNCYLGNSR